MELPESIFPKERKAGKVCSSLVSSTKMMHHGIFQVFVQFLQLLYLRPMETVPNLISWHNDAVLISNIIGPKHLPMIPESNIGHENWPSQHFISQRLIFRGELLVSGRAVWQFPSTIHLPCIGRALYQATFSRLHHRLRGNDCFDSWAIMIRCTCLMSVLNKKPVIFRVFKG